MRPYAGEIDLKGTEMIIVATDDKEVNAIVSQDANRNGILLNDVEQSSRSTFIVPSVVRRGKLIITVSTSGASPGLAYRIRNELEHQYGNEYEIYVNFLAELREKVKEKIVNEEVRGIIFHNVLNFDIIDQVRKGTFNAFRERLMERIEQEYTPEQWKQFYTIQEGRT